MIVALDVGYSANEGSELGTCGIVGFEDWGDDDPAYEGLATTEVTEPYKPGRLYLRELPCLLAGLEQQREDTGAGPSMIVVDGNVRLDSTGRRGLGMLLYEQLGSDVPVIGVAKNAFEGLDAKQVVRGVSKNPLYVTAVGVAEHEAADNIAIMSGSHRIPTLLKRADQLSRER